MDLLHEAAQWRLLGLLLAAPRGDWRRELTSLAECTDDADLQAAARLALEEAEEALYDTSFGPGGPAPPREVSYRPASLSSQHLAELGGAYRAFDYTPPYDEPVDHVAVVTDFVAYLKLKEAFALAQNELDLAETARAAAAHVLSEHLAYVGHPLAERLAASGVRYLAAAAEALSQRTGPPQRRAGDELAILADDCGDGDAWACGEQAESDDS